MAVRARDFATAHPIDDPSFAIVVSRLGATIAEADAAAILQGDGTIDEHAAIAQRQDFRKSIPRIQLKRLVHIAQLATKTHPELKGKFPMPSSTLPLKPFLLAARALLAAAVPQEQLFVSLGLGTSYIADLTQALDTMEGATGTAHTGRSEHVGAGANLLTLARDCVRDVEILDTWYRATNAEDSDVVVAWESASKVRSEKHDEAVTPEPDPEPAPVPVPEPEPASLKKKE
jgi:hypothetical protein